jgi:hypothetical protein
MAYNQSGKALDEQMPTRFFPVSEKMWKELKEHALNSNLMSNADHCLPV